MSFNIPISRDDHLGMVSGREEVLDARKIMSLTNRRLWSDIGLEIYHELDNPDSGRRKCHDIFLILEISSSESD